MALNDLPRTLSVTADGSKTISITEACLSYHSKHGAIAECNLVYIQNNLLAAFERKDSLQVLEIGFGTGLNALLTLKEARQYKKQISYCALEPYPLEAALFQALEYTAQDDSLTGLKAAFLSMHQCEANHPLKTDPFFEFIRFEKRIQDFESPTRFDVIYFDAFAPLSQPEMWTESVFIQLFNATLPGGTLSTYCSKSTVRQAMQAAGFVVKKVPGPFGKREMVIATKPA